MRTFYEPSLWILQHFLLTHLDLHHRLLGEIFETVGGGGHERVGASIVSPTDLKVVEERVQKILEQIRVREQARQKAFAEPRSGDQLYPSSR